MVKSILLPLLEGATTDNAREYAFWFAQKHGGQIHALGLIDVKSFEIPVLGTPDGFMPAVVSPPVHESEKLLEEMVALARERLEQLAPQQIDPGSRQGKSSGVQRVNEESGV